MDTLFDEMAPAHGLAQRLAADARTAWNRACREYHATGHAEDRATALRAAAIHVRADRVAWSLADALERASFETSGASRLA